MLTVFTCTLALVMYTLDKAKAYINEHTHVHTYNYNRYYQLYTEWETHYKMLKLDLTLNQYILKLEDEGKYIDKLRGC